MFYFAVTLLIVALSVQFVQSDTCGRRPAIDLQLVNYGSISRLGEWPWHSAVFYRVDKALLSYACGGSILSRNYVVTAAHCTWPKLRVRPLTAHELEVFVGITNIRQLEPSLKQMAVARIERHEDYVRSTSENDIALLQLAGELEFTSYVKPICLWKGTDGEEEIVGKQGYVAGWGRDENNSLPDSLKHVIMPIISRKDCRASDKLYYTTYLYDGKAFCAGFRNGSSVNSGDSGSGLYIEIDGEWQLRGIVSNGKINPTTRLVDTSSFIVFTDVAHFRPWIRLKMGLESTGVQKTEDYAVCGRKDQPKYNRLLWKERQWPWQGEVYRSKLLLCDVVIVNESFLLSPADVYSGKDVRDPVNLRAVFRNGTGYILGSYPILRVLRHENYTHETRMNNIALLELAVKITFTRLLRPICVWSIESTVEGIKGYTQDHKPLEVVDYKECDSNEEGTFCLRDAILSDFVYIQRNGTWYLRGVIFNVTTTFTGGYYKEMQEVYRYKDWIQSQQHQGHSLESKSHNLLAQNCIRQDDNILYMVSIANSLKCFASLIAPSLLITTGSCVDGVPTEYVSVFIVFTDNLARKVHLHPLFDKQRLINNIAIIELNAPFEEPVLFCLPTFPENLSKRQTFIGMLDPWDLNITNVETCAHRWRGEGIQLATDGSHICANVGADTIEKMKKENPELCEQISLEGISLEGLPLAYKVKDRYVMRGILEISLTNHCDPKGLSEVFIDVTFYTDWILDVYSKCSSCPKSSVLDDEDEEPANEWRNLSPRNSAARQAVSEFFFVVMCGYGLYRK